MKKQDDLTKRITNLSPEQRAFLESRLIKESRSGAQKDVIPPREIFSPAPLSFAQQRLWFLDQLESDNPAYNIPRAFHLMGRLDVAVLEACLNEIVRRHEVLRTIFSVVDGKPIQVIAPTLNFTLPVVALDELSETDQEVEVQRLVTEEAQRPFDLAQAPLFRVTLLNLSSEEHVFLLTMHHIVSDDWSMGLLWQELSVLYPTFYAGKPSPLPELPIQYADFAVWQREWLQREVLEKRLAYWKQHLKGAPPMLELPTDRLRPARQTFRGARDSLIISKSLSKALKELSQQEGVTLFMTLLATFKVLLHRYIGQEDIVVGTPIAGRNRDEIDGLIGFFVKRNCNRSEILAIRPCFR
jgi:hypothetical protein